MADIVDTATRSRMMAGIRGSNTQPELRLRRELHALGFRYRLNDRRLPGAPDIVLPRYGAVIFVHGCFWHRHAACRFATTPVSREEFWSAKFKANVERDQRNQEKLLELGWRVGTVWECALNRKAANPAERVARWITSRRPILTIDGPTSGQSGR